MRIKIVMLIRIHHNCVALIHKKTVLSLETSSEINFEFIKFKKNVKCLPLTKQLGNIKYLVIVLFITIFDNFLSFAKSSRPICAQTKMQQHMEFLLEISVIKFHAWPT